jgi:hypothetical protein
MKDMKKDAAGKIAIINIVLLMTVFLLQPDIVARYKAVDSSPQIKQSLKSLAKEVITFCENNDLSIPESPRLLKLNKDILGLEHIPSSWEDFNTVSKFYFFPKQEHKFTGSAKNLLFIEREKTNTYSNKVYVIFEDGHVSSVSLKAAEMIWANL